MLQMSTFPSLYSRTNRDNVLSVKREIPECGGKKAPTYLLWILVLLFTFGAQAATIEGKVIKVADGDTVTILVNRQKHRIRLQGIDAPERKQTFGRASGRALSALVAGKRVRVEFDKRDRYGRIVGTVWVSSPEPSCNTSPCPKNPDAGLHLVEQGLAWWYRRFAKEQTEAARKRYERAEAEARRERVGLWREPNPVAPWDWRRQQRNKRRANKQ